MKNQHQNLKHEKNMFRRKYKNNFKVEISKKKIWSVVLGGSGVVEFGPPSTTVNIFQFVYPSECRYNFDIKLNTE